MDEEHFNRYINLGITSDDMLSLLNDKNITERDLAPFKYPNLRDLKKLPQKPKVRKSYKMGSS